MKEILNLDVKEFNLQIIKQHFEKMKNKENRLNNDDMNSLKKLKTFETLDEKLIYDF